MNKQLIFQIEKLKEENSNLRIKIEGLTDFYKIATNNELFDDLLLKALKYYLEKEGNFTNRSKLNNLIIELESNQFKQDLINEGNY